MKKRIVSIALCLCMLAVLFSGLTLTANAAGITDYMQSTYNKALGLAGVSSFNGWCGNCVGYQLQALGINTSLLSRNGNATYDLYASMSKTSGGYAIGKYPATTYSLSSFLSSVNSQNASGAYTFIVLGFEKGWSDSDGQAYGHTLLIYQVYGGTVYYTESFGTAVRSKTISEFCSTANGYGCRASGNATIYQFEGAVWFTATPTNVSVSTNKTSYTLGETVTITPSATNVKQYTYRIEFGGSTVASDFNGFTGTKTYTPTEPGTYKVRISAYNDSGFADANCTFTVIRPEPTGVTLSETELSLANGESAVLTATVTPSNANQTVTWETSDALVATVSDGTVTAQGEGVAMITASAGNASATCVVSVAQDASGFSAWSETLPDGVTEENYTIETRTTYRYRDTTSSVEYGAWGSSATTSTKPTESDTLRITNTTKYYNYYHYCSSSPSGEVNSVEYTSPSGVASNIHHTIKLTSPLSAINEADRGKKQLYGNYKCAKGWVLWAQASPFETYEYTYQTRTKNNVTSTTDWTAWSTVAPAAAANREIEVRTIYRYKESHVHAYSGVVTVAPTCTTTGVKTYTCTECGDAYGETLAALGHSFTNYVSDGNATCDQDGTKTAKCDRCPETKTVQDEGSFATVPHTWKVTDGEISERIQDGKRQQKKDTWYTCIVCGERETVEGEWEDVDVPDPEPDPDAPTLTVVGGKARPGKTVTVALDLSNNSGIAGMRLSLAYDSALTLTSATAGDALTELTFTRPGDLTANPVTLFWDGQDGDTSNGTIVNLTFTVAEDTADGEYPITVTYQSSEVYDGELENVALNVVNGSVTVKNYMLGDVNDDDEVNGKDITVLRRYFAGGYGVTINALAADVNGDGEANGKDITVLRRYFAGGYGITLE